MSTSEENTPDEELLHDAGCPDGCAACALVKARARRNNIDFEMWRRELGS